MVAPAMLRNLLPASGHRPLVHRLRLPFLLVVPVLLAVATVLLLVLPDDTLNMAALYSQCRAHARLPYVSQVPVLGAPACFLVSFFELALDSARAWARMTVALAFLAALLTVSLVESERLSNRRTALIARPTIPWLFFNLLPIVGPLVWDLVLLPSFLRRAKQIQLRRQSAAAEQVRDANPDIDREVRALSSQVEVLAIPIAVWAGFVVPSVAMLVSHHPVAIAVWLFFPLWVAVVRHVVQIVGVNAVRDPGPFHLESSWPALLTVYAVPTACSVLAHGALIANFLAREDRREMTRAVIRFIEIDMAIVAATVVYWLLVEAGVLLTLGSLVLSVVLGPGAGLCGGWILREKAIEKYPDDVQDGQDESTRSAPDEESPLLRD